VAIIKIPPVWVFFDSHSHTVYIAEIRLCCKLTLSVIIIIIINTAQTKLHTWHRCMCSRHDAFHRDSSSTARICYNHTALTTATHCTIYQTLTLQPVLLATNRLPAAEKSQ